MSKRCPQKCPQPIVADTRARARCGRLCRLLPRLKLRRRAGVVRGEAAHDPVSDEAKCPRHEWADTRLGLLDAALTRENLQRAFKRVRANVLLDEVDKELEWGGHCFARYADDCNVYVRSRRARQRVMAVLRKLYGKLHLAVNEAKSAVASVFGRKFLGYSLWMAKGGVVKRRVADKPIATFKQRVRQLTRRSGGRSMPEVVQRMRPYVLGWKAYFGLSQTPKVWREFDEWLRHRMRAIQLKHWKRGTTIFREPRALGAPQGVAQRVAANSRRWWRNSAKLLNSVLTIDYCDRLGVPRLS